MNAVVLSSFFSVLKRYSQILLSIFSLLEDWTLLLRAKTLWCFTEKISVADSAYPFCVLPFLMLFYSQHGLSYVENLQFRDPELVKGWQNWMRSPSLLGLGSEQLFSRSAMNTTDCSQLLAKLQREPQVNLGELCSPVICLKLLHKSFLPLFPPSIQCSALAPFFF